MGNNVTPPAPKEALTQWIVDTLVSEVVRDITAEGLLTRVLQSDVATERVEALTVQLKQKLRAHIEQKALDELEAEFAGDLEVLNRWPEAEGMQPETTAEATPTRSAEDAETADKHPTASTHETVDTVPDGFDPAEETTDTAEREAMSRDTPPGDPDPGHPVVDEDVSTSPAVAEEQQASEEAKPVPHVAPVLEVSNDTPVDQTSAEDTTQEGTAAEQQPEDAEEAVEDLIETFGSFPEDPTADASTALTDETAATERAPRTDDTSDDEPGNEADNAPVEQAAPEVIHEPESYAPEASHEAAGAEVVDEEAIADVVSHEPLAEATSREDDADALSGKADDPLDSGFDEAADEEPDFSPIDWDAEPDPVDFPDAEPSTVDADEDVALDDAFFDGDFFPDVEAGEEATTVDGEALPEAAVATPDAPAATVTADDILFARAVIGGAQEARAALRKTFSHDTFSLIEWPAFDVLVEAVGAREDQDRSANDTLAKVLQRMPSTLPIIPLRDPHPAQSMAELRGQVEAVEDGLRDALEEQSAQEAWHMSVLMDKEDVRRYVVDHHTPVREHLQEMRGKPQGVARFIKKKMVETINEEVDRLANECAEAVAALMQEHGNDITEVAHTPGREGDYYHLAQIAGLFDPDREDVLVALTSDLVETYGMYGFIFRPEGPSKPRHFPMVFPEADGGV